MAKKRAIGSKNSFGNLSFLFGALIAVIIGMLSPNASGTGLPTLTLTSLLILLGLVVGFLNITHRETNQFLLASVSLVIVSAIGGGVIGQVQFIGRYVESVLVAIVTFVIPAAIVVAVKTIYAIEEN